MVVEVIDVTNWIGDEQHAIFPVGARDKEMLWSPEKQIDGIKSSWPYLFKESIHRYPDQFWTELVAYIVSKYLDVDVPKVFPAIKKNKDELVCGSLIEWFYDVSRDRFVHAGSYFKRIIPEFDDKTGKQHNYADMNTFIRAFAMNGLVTERVKWLADLELFDSLIGNTDRHQENWGVIFQGDGKLRLSPLFDNGTSLGHERFLHMIKDWDDNRLKSYINRGCHHLRFNRQNTKQRIKHFKLVDEISLSSKDIKKYMQRKIDALDLISMLAEIEDLTKIDIDVPFTQERFNWIKRNIVMRLELLKEEVKK